MIMIILPSGSIIIIQLGYRKCGTHAQVFSQTLAHGNNKNEIRPRKREEDKQERINIGMYSRHEINNKCSAYANIQKHGQVLIHLCRQDWTKQYLRRLNRPHVLSAPLIH